MVIIVCRDDQRIADMAAASARANGLGAVYKLDDPVRRIPQLGADEDLFITAHGARTDSSQRGNAMVGDQQDGGYGYNAVDLFARLNALKVFPAGYQGDVYVSACESADWMVRTGFSFVEAFRTQIEDRDVGYRGTVYGNRGKVDMEIPERDSAIWQSG